MDSGWQTVTVDSLPPLCTFSIPLDGDWQDSAYSVNIEYPELIKINESDLKRWKMEEFKIPSWPKVDTFVGVSHKKATLDVSFVPLINRDGQLYVIDSYKFVVNSDAVVSQTLPRLGITEPRYTYSSVLSSGRWVKIRVSQSGVYKLTNSALRSMGFSDPSKVKLYGYGGEVLPETDLQNLTDDLPEQPLWRTDGYALFYAQGPVSWKRSGKGFTHQVNTYSDWGYYFLTDATHGAPAGFDEFACDTLIGSLIDTYPDYYVYDPDEFSWYNSGRRMFEAYDYANGNNRVYKFSLSGIYPDSVQVTVAYSASGSNQSRLNVFVNDAQTGTMTIGGTSGNNVATVKEQTFLSRGQFRDENTVRLVHDLQSGTSGHLDFIRLNFKRKLALTGSGTVFRTDRNVNASSFSISGTNADVIVWKCSSDGKWSIVPSLFSNGTTTTLSASFNTDDLLVAVNPNASFPEPQVVGEVRNQNLHGLDSIDMVIVVPASGKLTAQAERLAQVHSTFDSLKVAVVRADVIYNEFSSGTPDATAIRRFMKMLYDRGQEGLAPSYLLLMGGGVWDNRMHSGEWKGCTPDDYLLCYESYNSLSHTESYVMEDYYGLLDDTEGKNLLSEKVDVGVGRIPVTSAAQANGKVDQLVDYITGKYRGSWTNRILVLGDDGDNNIHMRDADEVAGIYESVNPAVNVRKVFWDAYNMEVSASYNGYPAVRKYLFEQFKEGALIVNYSGHGSTEVLSHELVLNKADMSELRSNHLPFWITASCDIAPFDSPLSSLGMNLFNNSQGGAIGMLSTTRTVFASLNITINRAFSKYVLAYSPQGVPYSVGDALRLAKNDLVTTGGNTDMSANKLHFVLLGDPALRLALPRMTAVVDSLTDMSGAKTTAAQAGAVIQAHGHIEFAGKKVDGFNGSLSGTVFDSERMITCNDNLKTADEPFQFMYRDRILYSGTDSVKNGEFSFTFPVPLDINYSGDDGKIILYAQSSEYTANGSFSAFTVGGTYPNLENDFKGPDIKLYLNTPSFQYGGNVNKTPTLVVELSDSSGLNTSGNGLGHDILLVIDNNPNWTWTLNSIFVQTNGDYTRGMLTFNIPELPEGKHTLMLRAWDMMNNSSTVYLGFKVVNDLEPKFKIDVTKSPARESTEFVITHDRPGQQANVTVQVSDMTGTLQWTASVQDSGQSGVTVIQWNLHGNSGHRMQPGLYLVKAMVGTPDGAGSTASCKLVIVGK